LGAGAAAAVAPRFSWGAPQLSQAAPAPKFPQEPAFEKLRPFLAPGSDGFGCEAEAARIHGVMSRLLETRELPLAAEFSGDDPNPGLARWIDALGEVRSARFYPLENGLVRYEVASRDGEGLAYRVGEWEMYWAADGGLRSFREVGESLARSSEPLFRDETASCFGGAASFRDQLAHGIPYWRARLDLACGIDIYGQNGIAAGDIDNDGWDEVYVCQPGGLPNRLYKRGADGAFDDITEKAGVGLLDDASAALFADFRNCGLQDLIVLGTAGPLYFVNEGAGVFRLREDAFRFASPARGAFTGMAAADYDGDGRLDLYLCSYIYFQSEDQYSYPSPYHDSRNGPPNFLFRNSLGADGSGFFEDVTAAVGLDENNDRYSFAPAWCDYDFDGLPELYVANDFGRNNLYKLDGKRFRDIAAEAGVEDLGPGMSAAWFDAHGDGRPDLYVTNMWTAAGRRVTHDPEFAPVAEGGLAEQYRRHTKGNSLYRNRGDGTFEETDQAQMGRWSWSGDGLDFDLDGRPEILIAAGMLTEPSGGSESDLMSFFWRRVVGETSLEAAPSAGYQEGWNALNQFVREGISWNGGEPNVMYRFENGRAIDVSGVSGLDVALDSRSFAATDLNGDGRLDVLLKNRLGPQVQALVNQSASQNHVIVIELEGTKSNRDAIGAWVTAEHDGGVSAAGLNAGSGYLCQHTKRLYLGLREANAARKLTVRWPSGAVETFANVDAERRYRIVEGRGIVRETPLGQASKAPKPKAFESRNDSAREATWLLEPVPLPEAQPGPGFVTISAADTSDRQAWYALFQRYLLDYRGALELPLTLLIDDRSRAHKVYFTPPDEEMKRADLAALTHPRTALALPFAGRALRPFSRSYFRHGAAFYQAGFPEQALPYLDEVLRGDPDNFKALLAVGQIHLGAGRTDEARPFVEQAARLRPDSPEALNNLGGLALAQDDPARAVEAFERALAAEPDLPYALANAGYAYSRLGRLEDAERVLRRAVQAAPADADALDQLGLTLARREKLDEAKVLFQRAIEAQRDHVSAISNLAVLYLKQSRPSEAVAALRYGIRVAPQDERLYLNLAKVYVQTGDRERARDVMEQLLTEQPDSEVARTALRELNLP
jgi:Flp pilus assembly protein TadD